MKPSFDVRGRLATNGLSSVADYVLPQIGLLAAAPLLLRHLGEAQLGIWMIATAATSGGALLSSSFGDAAIRFASDARERGDSATIEGLLRATLALNLALGVIVATLLWGFAPLIAHHIALLSRTLQQQSILSLRIGAALLIFRSVEAVYVSAFRAFERYGPAVRITAGTRLLALIGAVVMASHGASVAKIMILSVFTSALSVFALSSTLRATTGLSIVSLSFEGATHKRILEFGCLTWLQAISALVFSHLDRILIGVLLGPAAVAIYGICVQSAQPVHTLVSTALHGTFPHLSARLATSDEVRSTVALALRFNLGLSCGLAAPLVLFAHPALSVWFGAHFADSAFRTFAILTVAYGLLSLNVTAHFCLLAFGRVRQVTAFNLLGGAASLVLLWPLTRSFGITGAACARLAYGPITWFAYITLYRALQSRVQAPVPFAPSSLAEGQ